MSRRRFILSATERENLMDLLEGEDDLIRPYSFTESDLSLIRQRQPARLRRCGHRLGRLRTAGGEDRDQQRASNTQRLLARWQ